MKFYISEKNIILSNLLKVYIEIRRDIFALTRMTKIFTNRGGEGIPFKNKFKPRPLLERSLSTLPFVNVSKRRNLARWGERKEGGTESKKTIVGVSFNRKPVPPKFPAPVTRH